MKNWPEPFGLVMIEAMACGTPVVGFRCGSVPEVVKEGVSGFVVETVDQAAAAVARVASLDRANVRAAFENRFAIERAVHEYVEIYQQLIASFAPLKRFRKPSGERKRETSDPKKILVPRTQPIQTMRVGVGGKPSAKARDTLRRPVAEPSQIVRNAAGETLSDDGVSESLIGSGKSPDTP
jgi:hypothetical protein